MSNPVTTVSRNRVRAPSASTVKTDGTTEHFASSICVPAYFDRKALAIRLLGAVLFVPAAPIILFLIILVRCTSAGPGLFGQKRVGKDGREFTMYKIRTMYHDAEATTGPIWCRTGDSRVTLIGRLLRCLHLDELPQLINVVRGEMDLTGPRPERPSFVEQLVGEIPDYAERLAILPGVTGLAQINLPPDVTTDCVRRKLILDLEYIETASFSLDVRILMCTLLRMIGIRHGYAARLMKLSRNVRVEKTIPVTFVSRDPQASPQGTRSPRSHNTARKTRRRIDDRAVIGLSTQSAIDASDKSLDEYLAQQAK